MSNYHIDAIENLIEINEIEKRNSESLVGSYENELSIYESNTVPDEENSISKETNQPQYSYTFSAAEKKVFYLQSNNFNCENIISSSFMKALLHW